MAKKNRLRVTIFSRLLSQTPRQSIRRILELSWADPGRIRSQERRHMRPQRKPFAIALGNLTPTNPRATLSVARRKSRPRERGRTADTVGGGLGSASVGSVGRRRSRLRLGRLGRAVGSGLGSASVGSVGRRREITHLTPKSEASIIVFLSNGQPPKRCFLPRREPRGCAAFWSKNVSASVSKEKCLH